MSEQRTYPELGFRCPRPPAFGEHQRTAFCEGCGKTVHNLTAMTAMEQQRLLSHEPAPCVRYRRTREAWTRAATLATLLATAPVIAQTDAPPAADAEPVDLEEVLVGAIVAPDPLESVFREVEDEPAPPATDGSTGQPGVV